MRLKLSGAMLFLFSVLVVIPLAASLAASERSVDLSAAENRWMERNPVIRVGSEAMWSPFSFIRNGAPSGYSVDYMNMLAGRLGVRVDYVKCENSKDAMSMLLSGDLDVILNIVDEGANQEQILFTDNYLRNLTVIYGREDSPAITSLKDMSGKTLVLPAGHFGEKTLKSHYPEIKILSSVNSLEALKALALGEADAALGELAVMEDLAQEYNIVGLRLTGRVFDERFESIMSMGTRKDLPMLHSALQKAMKSISYEEKRDLQGKWLVKTVETPQLTEEEKKWISSHRTLRVANEMNWPPYDFNLDGRATGFSMDLIELLAERIGVEVEYVTDDWSELLERGKRKEIDVFPCIWRTPERENYLSFSASYVQTPNVLVVNRDNTTVIRTLDDLKGLRLSLVSGFAFNSWIETNYPAINIIKVESSLEGLKKVALGEADAHADGLGTAVYAIKSHMLPNLKVASEVKTGEQPSGDLYIAVRKDWPVLQQLIDKVLKAMPPEETSALHQKWLTVDESSVSRPFSAKEAEWLQHHRNVRMGSAFDWAPFEFIDEEGKLRGLSSELVGRLSSELGIGFEQQRGLYWQEVLDGMKARKLDVISAIVATPERAKKYDMTFTEPYIDLPVMIITRTGSRYVQSLNDLGNASVAVIKGFVIEDYLKRDHPNLRLVYCNTVKECMLRTSSGEADICLETQPVFEYAKKRYRIENLQVTSQTHYNYTLRMGVRSDWPELVSALNKKLAEVGDDEMTLMLDKWTTIRVEKSIDWGVLIKWVSFVILMAAIIVAVLLSTNRRMAKEVKQRKLAEEAAEAANQAKSEFLDDMSHEIRTPMNAVMGFAEILRELEHDPKKRHYIDNINSSGQALLKLINDVLDLSKIEGGKLELQYSAVSLEKMFDEISTVFENKINDKGIMFEEHCGCNVPKALILDESRIHQVLMNLVGNAVKFTTSGSICLRASVVERIIDCRSRVDLAVEVEDTGSGIPEDQLDKVFGVFEQTAGPKTALFGGTGLGLAITQRLTTMMGGEISVCSELGKGSVFSLFIPGVEVAAVESVAAAEPATIDFAAITFEPATILVVDDIDFNREMLVTYLSEWNFTFIEAANGREAIDLALQQKPDLMLLDIKMPVMDGYETRRIMMETDELKEIPVVAVTASVLKSDELAISNICAGYLRKPVSKHQLVSELLNHLPHKMSESEQTAEKPGEQVALTPELLASLPESLLTQLKKAVVSVDQEEILNLLDCADAMSPEIKMAIRRLVDNYAYDVLHDIMDEV